MTSSISLTNIPDISDDEIILRAAFVPHNFNNSRNKIKLNVFQSPKGSEDLSCFRFSILNLQECIQRSRQIALKRGNNVQFISFVALTKFCIISSGASVVDSSANHFLGHADIKLGIIRPKDDGVPLSAEDNAKLGTIKDELMRHSLELIIDIQKYNPPQHENCKNNALLCSFATSYEYTPN